MIEAPSETGVEDWSVTFHVPFSANWLRAGSVVPAYKLHAWSELLGEPLGALVVEVGLGRAQRLGRA